MAVQVTYSHTNTIRGASRITFRDSNGIPHIVCHDTNDGIVIWSGNSVTPTGFLGSASNYGVSWLGLSFDIAGISAAMDANDLIHLLAITNEGKASQLRYNTYNTQNHTFGTQQVINGDIGGAPTSALLYTAIALDSNNIPHIAYTELPAIMGTDTYVAMYTNRIGGSWKSPVQVRYQSGENCSKIDIAFELHDRPLISFFFTGYNWGWWTKGNVNNATIFNENHTDTNGTTDSSNQIVVTESGDRYKVGTNTSGKIYLVRNLYGDNFSTFSNPTSTITGSSCTTVTAGKYIYIIFVDANNDIAFTTYNTETTIWAAPVVLEAGTFNSVRAKWGFYVDNDSTGALVNVEGNHSFPVSGYSVFSMYGGTGAVAKVGQSIDLPDTTIYSVQVLMRKYGTPTDNFFCKIYSDDFEVGLVATSALLSANILTATDLNWITFDFPTSVDLTAGTYYIVFERTANLGTGNTIQFANGNSASRFPGVISLFEYGVWTDYANGLDLCLSILTRRKPVEIDYVFLDESATPDLWWGTISLEIPTTWIQKTLKWYNGSTWVQKPLKYYNGASWTTKPVKSNL